MLVSNRMLSISVYCLLQICVAATIIGQDGHGNPQQQEQERLLMRQQQLQQPQTQPQSQQLQQPRFLQTSNTDVVGGDFFGGLFDNLFGNIQNLLCEWNLVFGLCVCTTNGLKSAIEDDDDTSITICRNSRLSFSTSIDISNKSVKIDCWDFLSGIISSKCIFDGNGITRFFQGTNVQLELQDLTFTKGKNPTSDSDNTDGGAILLLDSAENKLVVNNCQFENNEALGAGGAIRMTSGTMEITDSTFDNNVATDGGAIAIQSTSSVNLDNTIFQNNIAQAASAVFFNVVAQTTISSSKFLNNDSTSVPSPGTAFGAAIGFSQTKATLTDTLFAGNIAVARADVSFDIVVLDDGNPTSVGSNVQCLQDVVFCDGTGGVQEFGPDSYDNTDCDENGLEGTPGQGDCPA